MVADLEPMIDVAPRVRSRLTADEFAALCESGAFGDVHVELVDGEIVEMPPEGSGHGFNNVQSVLVLGPIARRVGGLDIGINTAVRLNSGQVVGPDLVICDELRTRPSQIPVDRVRFALEHSWSTRRYDLTVKSQLYAAAGVPEYWVLDDVAVLLHRFHTPVDSRYTRNPPLGPDERVAVPFAPGETVRVGDLFRSV